MKPLSPSLRRVRTTLVVIAALVLIYAALGWFGVPALLRWGAETIAARELDRRVSVDDIRFNPFTLKLDLHGLTVAGAEGETEPMLVLRGASVNVAWASLFRFAPVVDALWLDGLNAHVIRSGPQRFNFSDIVDRQLAKPPTPDTGPARFAVHNIELVNSELHFDDRVRERHDDITAITLGIPFISSLPVDAEIRVQPAFSAQFNGAPLALTGALLPFGASLDTVLKLKLDGQSLPNLLSFAPVEFNFGVPTGELDADLTLTYRRAVAATATEPASDALLALTGTAALRDVELQAAGKPARLFAFKRLAVELDEVRVLTHRAALREISLDGAEIEFLRDAGGSNWQRLIAQPLQPDEAAAPAASTAVAPAQPWQFAIDRIRVADGRAHLVDATVGGAERRVEAIALDIRNLGNAPDARATVAASARTPEGEALTIDGSTQLAPLAGALRIALKDGALDALAPWLAGALDGSLAGRADVAATLDFAQRDANIDVKLADLALALRQLRLRGPADSGADLDIARLALDGGTVDLGARSIALGRLAIDAPTATVRRLADGSLGWMRLVRASAGGAAEGASVDAPAAASAGASDALKPSPAAKPGAAAQPVWKLTLADTRVNGGDLSVEDFTQRPVARLRATAIDIGAGAIEPGSAAHVPLTFKAAVGKGRLAADGWISLAPVAAQLKLDIGRLDAAQFQPWIAPYLNAVLVSALASTRGDLDLALPANAAPRVNYRGSLRIEDMRLAGTAGAADLLRWQALDIDRLGVTGGDPPALDIGRIVIGGFFARAEISPQGRLNLADLRKRPADSAGDNSGAAAAAARGGKTTAGATTTAPLPAAAAPPAPAPRIRIETIVLGNGNVDFTDHFVQPNYHANLTDLGGAIGRLAFDAPEPAEVRIEGRIDGDAPVTIGGRANPLAPKLMLDITASARGVDLPGFTPYSTKYAGYPIVKGKLSVDLGYKVADDRLTATNHLFLDQLTFGERVDSPTATDLPVLLAVALLKNSRGEIDLDLPVSGSLDDPQFSIGGVIGRALVNLVTRAVTAPFRLLSSMFGGGEELGQVEFAPGAATLADDQRARLSKLAGALADRPQLRLDVTGRADPARDIDGLRRVRLEEKLLAASGRASAASAPSALNAPKAGNAATAPNALDVSDAPPAPLAPAERAALLGRLYGDAKLPDKPRNVLGFARDLPPADMEARLLAAEPVTPDDLRELAVARARNVVQRLVAEDRIARDRLFLTEPKTLADDLKGAPGMRVEFGLK